MRCTKVFSNIFTECDSTTSGNDVRVAGLLGHVDSVRHK